VLVALLICAVKNKNVDFSCLVYLSTRAVELFFKKSRHSCSVYIQKPEDFY